MQHRYWSTALSLCVTVLCVSTAAARDCDRACLTQTLNQYLSAVIAHDASKAPLAANYRATENAREVKAGEGAWQSIKALGEVQRRYADPVSQQAGYFGLVNEGAGPALASLRLKVVDGKVTEAEWILGRKGMALYKPEGLIANPPPQTVAAANRTPRATLIEAANSYFNGIQGGDGNLVMAHPNCYRIENGTWMLGEIPERQSLGNDAMRPRTADQACNSGFERLGARNNGGGGVINRHFFADEEAGIGWGTAIFSRDDGVKDARGQLVKWLYVTEVFRVEQGKIRGLFAAMDYLPPEIKTSGWSPEPCDRSCLTGVMDNYLSAVSKHDATGLPLAATVAVRENGKVAAAGKSDSWSAVVKTHPGYMITSIEDGTVVYGGAVDTSGDMASMLVRLKVVDRKITEIETILNRSTPSGVFNPKELQEYDLIYDAVVPVSRRSSRDKMIAVVNGYMEGFGVHAPRTEFSLRCDRYGSGAKTTNNPAGRGGAISCPDSFKALTGDPVVDRRFPLVDEATGMVVAFFQVPHGERDPKTALYVGEMFKVVDGKIRSIEEFSNVVPYPPKPVF